MGEAAQGRLEEPEELQRPLQGPEGHDAALGRLDAEGEGAGVNGLGPGRPGFGFGAKASLSLGGRGFPGDSLLGPLAHLFFLKVRGQRPCFRMEGRQGLGVEERGGGGGRGAAAVFGKQHLPLYNEDVSPLGPTDNRAGTRPPTEAPEVWLGLDRALAKHGRMGLRQISQPASPEVALPAATPRKCERRRAPREAATLSLASLRIPVSQASLGCAVWPLYTLLPLLQHHPLANPE